jgi:hypothetical protein
MNHFTAAVFAGRYGNGGTRNLQKICKEFDAGLVGPTLDRRSRQCQLKRIADFASDRSPLGPRVHSYREARTRLCFENRNHRANRLTFHPKDRTNNIAVTAQNTKSRTQMLVLGGGDRCCRPMPSVSDHFQQWTGRFPNALHQRIQACSLSLGVRDTGLSKLLELEVSSARCSPGSAIAPGRRQQVCNSPQTLPGRLIQGGVRADEIANHIPGSDVKSALWRRSHGQRYRALRAEAYPLGGRFLPRPNSNCLREHIDGNRFVSSFELPTTAKIIEIFRRSSSIVTIPSETIFATRSTENTVSVADGAQVRRKIPARPPPCR